MAITTLLATGRRTGAAVSSTLLVPLTAQAVTIAIEVLRADRIDVRNTVTFHIYKSADGGQTWQHDCGATWTARAGGLGKGGVVEPNPSARWRGEALKSLAGKLIRVECVANRLQTYTVTADLT